jgi:hypothetical protein
MRTKTYKIMANETAADVVKNNDISLGGGYTLDEAWRVSLLHQRAQKFICVWIEEEPAKPAPRITRSIERDYPSKAALKVVKVDGWTV